MNVARGDGYELLCPFLGVDVPVEAFPWNNLGADRPAQDREGGGPVVPSRPRGAMPHGRGGSPCVPAVSTNAGALGTPLALSRASAPDAGWAVAGGAPSSRAHHSDRQPSSRRAPRGGPRRRTGPRRRRNARTSRPSGDSPSCDRHRPHPRRLRRAPTVPDVPRAQHQHSGHRDPPHRRCRAPIRRMAGLLGEWARLDGVRVLHNDLNVGYTRTVNRGIAACSGDVVLLNSDCEVTPRWLEHLIECAYRDAKTATVTAISDNAGAFSVPEIGVANDRPPHLSGDEVGRLVTRTSQRIYPTTPTGNGFCMYIKRAALDGPGPVRRRRLPAGLRGRGRLLHARRRRRLDQRRGRQDHRVPPAVCELRRREGRAHAGRP